MFCSWPWWANVPAQWDGVTEQCQWDSKTLNILLWWAPVSVLQLPLCSSSSAETAGWQNLPEREEMQDLSNNLLSRWIEVPPFAETASHRGVTSSRPFSCLWRVSQRQWDHQAGALIGVWGLCAALFRSCQPWAPKVFPTPNYLNIRAIQRQWIDIVTPCAPISLCQSQRWKERNRGIQNSRCPHLTPINVLFRHHYVFQKKK